MSPTVAQLLASGVLNETEVVGGRHGLGRRVRSVSACTTLSRLSSLAPDTVAVFGPEDSNIEDLDAETAIRIATGVGLVGLIFISEAPRHALVTTRRLADKLGIPIVVGKSLSVGDVVERLDYMARFPELGIARALQEFIRRLPLVGHSPERLLGAVSDQLSCTVSVVDAYGSHVRGSTETGVTSPQILDHLQSPRPSGRSMEGPGGATFVVEPVAISRDGPANLWLIATLTASTEERIDLARHLLAVSAWPLATELLQRSLTAEREGRQRSMLLTEVVEHSSAPPRQTVERATALGWRLSGWHTAISIASRDSGADARGNLAARVIEDGLKLHGLVADLVERPEGWVFWTTTEVEPMAEDSGKIVRRVRDALEWVASEVPSASLAAGVGLPFEGADGIRASIQEAESACLLARTRSDTVAVEHSDATSVRRLLIGYYSNRPLRDVATHLMAPLHKADTSGELARTLTAFLDNNSSATATAKVLDVHRNTVLNRLDKITALLELDFSDPEDRLAAQLAVHLAELD